MLKCRTLGAPRTPHPSASNIAGTITVAIVPMPAYTTTFVSTYITKKREEAISAHISSKHKMHTHTISVISHSASPYHRPRAYHLHETAFSCVSSEGNPRRLNAPAPTPAVCPSRPLATPPLSPSIDRTWHRADCVWRAVLIGLVGDLADSSTLSQFFFLS